MAMWKIQEGGETPPGSSGVWHRDGKFVSGAPLSLAAAGGAVNTALLIGVGTTDDPAVNSTPDVHFIELRLKSLATSGDNRGLYLRQEFAGDGGGGDGMRSNTQVSAAASTVHGLHASVGFQTGGKVTGQSIGGRFGLLVPDRAMDSGGTYYPLQAEIFMEGTSSDISPVTEAAILSLQVVGGDATARSKVKNLLSVNGEDGTGEMIYCNSGTNPSHTGSIRFLLNGTVRYLYFWDAEA
jgi:hypothetical protein